MTQPTGLELVWALSGGVTDPSDSKYQLGWVAEIPTFQNFNYVIQNLDKAKLAYAEADAYPWQDKIAYKAGARVIRNGKTFYCRTTHNDFAGTNPQDPALDSTNSYWVSGTVFSTQANAFDDLRESDGIKLDRVNIRANSDLWSGNDITSRNLSNIIAMFNTDSNYDNLLFGNVRGKMVVVNVGKTQESPDNRSLLPSINQNSFEVFHEGHFPDVTEVNNALDKNPVDGKLYGRRNGNWVEVTTTTVNTLPPQAAVGAGATWYNLEDGRLYVDIYDGDTSQWVPASPPIVPELAAVGISYDNTASGLSASNLQASTDELAARQLVVNPNLLINGDFSVWQRGIASDDPSDGWGADRWKVSGFISVNKLGHSDISRPASGRWVMQYAKGSGNAYIDQSIEDGYWSMFGKSVTVTAILSVDDITQISSVQITDGSRDGVMGISFPTITPIAGSAGWYTLSATFGVIDAREDTENHVYLRFAFESGKSASGWIADVKLELGGQDTPFVADDPQTNLAKCQRYFYKHSGQISLTPYLNNTSYSTPVPTFTTLNFPVSMRAEPVVGNYDVTGATGAITTRSGHNSAAISGLTANGSIAARIDSYDADAEL